MPHVTYVFCHGLNGYGEYDHAYQRKPYWGGASGDVCALWRSQGLVAHAASVSAQGSAWDRACELFAQIAGTRTDYGRAHAQRYGHERIGRDFTGIPLVPSWDDDTRLVLIGHSFGGATIRLLAELLAHGSEREREATGSRDLSPLFAGGMGERVLALVTLAAPHNGTTAYELSQDPAFDTRKIAVPTRYRLWDRVLRSATHIRRDGRDLRDWADFDMRLDAARALNASIATLPHVYYLSVACDATRAGADGRRVADPALTDPLIVRNAALMGSYRTTTAGGIVVDDAWGPNDGLVNTISARSPMGAPTRRLEGGRIERGVWNVMCDLTVDHSYFQGGFIRRQNPQPFFRDLLELVRDLD